MIRYVTTLLRVGWIESLRRRRKIEMYAYYDALTEMVIERTLRNDSVCVDVGCHEGGILRMMMRCAPRGTFLAFEPLPHLYQQLADTFQGANIRVYGAALSNVDGTASFTWVVSNPGYSGLKPRAYDRGGETEEQLTVQTLRLDGVLAGDDIGPLTLMKVDVEGAEYLVFEGARARIARDKPLILFEHGIGGSDYFGRGPEDLFALLSDECGLRLSTLPRYLLGGRSMNLQEFSAQYHERKNYFFVAHR